jgi:phage protein U
MSAAELETLYYSEIDRVEQWRHEALARAGYDPESAFVLAASHDVDLHEAVELLERGCSVDLALQILL